MKILTFFKNLIDSLMSGSFERVRVINEMNESFKEHYYTGEMDRLCKVSVNAGDPDYKHEMSAFFLRSGFKISVENDSGFSRSEANELSNYVLSNTPFIRQLMSIGFDTLTIKGKTTGIGMQYKLSDYANLSGYALTGGK